LLFLAQNAPETVCRPGSARPRRSLSAPPDALAAVKGLGLPGRGKGKGKRREGGDGRREGREGRGFGVRENGWEGRG